MDLRKMASVIRNRLGLISAMVIVCCLAAGLSTEYLIEPKYEASVKVIVNKTSETGITSDNVSVNVQLIGTYLELARTDAVMGRVASEHPEFRLDSSELVGKVQFAAADKTQVITMTVRDTSYKRAAAIVNATASALQAKAAQIMKEDNITILDQASLNKTAEPVSPNMVLNTGIAFILSLVAAVALAFLLEHLNDTIRDEESAKNVLGIPSLAAIGRIEQTNNPGKTSVRRASDGVYATANQ